MRTCRPDGAHQTAGQSEAMNIPLLRSQEQRKYKELSTKFLGFRRLCYKAITHSSYRQQVFRFGRRGFNVLS